MAKHKITAIQRDTNINIREAPKEKLKSIAEELGIDTPLGFKIENGKKVRVEEKEKRK